MPWKPRPHNVHPRPRESRKHDRTTTERGYGWDWQKYRKAYLVQNPLCVDCEGEGIVSPATEVHHVTKIKHAPDKRFDGENLMALCGYHHDKRTSKGE